MKVAAKSTSWEELLTIGDQLLANVIQRIATCQSWCCAVEQCGSGQSAPGWCDIAAARDEPSPVAGRSCTLIAVSQQLLISPLNEGGEHSGDQVLVMAGGGGTDQQQACLALSKAAIAADAGGGLWSSVVFAVGIFQRAASSGLWHFGQTPWPLSAGGAAALASRGDSCRPMETDRQDGAEPVLGLGPFACGKR